MPNTLVHFSVQTPVSHAFFREADFKWIAVGCIIPDIPWIIQRIILAADTGADLYLVLTYVTIQASLFFCLILSAALCLVTKSSGRIFLLLSMNSLFHLVLDSMQIKWANGVHLMAPFSWRLTNFSLFWPEDVLIYVLTFLGFGVLVFYGIRDWRKPVVFSVSIKNIIASLLLFLVYLFLPLLMLTGPERANNHYASTLLNVDERPGKYIELDRSRFRKDDKTIRIFSGERLKAGGKIPEKDGVVSVKGHFIDEHTIEISEYHIHSPIRDMSSKMALAGVLVIWFAALAGKKIILEQRPLDF